jgi:O-antigen/teichoic acid export membrane protein
MPMSRLHPLHRQAADPAAALPVGAGAWSVVLRVAGAAITFLVGVQLARYLGPAGLGIYGMVMAAAALLASLAQLGLSTLSTREIVVSRAAGNWERVGAILCKFTVATILCGLLLGLASASAASAVLPRDFAPTLIWGAMTVPLAALVGLIGAYLRGLDLLVRGQALEVIVRPSLMCLLLLAVYFSGGLSPARAVAANLLSCALAVALGFAWVKHAVPAWQRRRRPVGELRGWLMAAAPLALTDLLRQLDGVYGVLVVGALSSAAETGIFRLAASTVAIVAIPNSVAHVTLAPTLARLHAAGDMTRLRSVLTSTARIMFAIQCAGAGAIAVTGDWLLRFCFGDAFVPAITPLLILAAAQAVSGFFGLGWVLLAMSSEEKPLARCFSLAAVVSLATAIPLVWLWGASGSALSAVLGTLAGNMLAWRNVRRTAGLDCSVLGLRPRR